MRLQNILPNIISMDQQGYLKNRYIGYNIRQIQDIIDYTDHLNIEGAILFLNFRKAIDTIAFCLESLSKTNVTKNRNTIMD